jgi:ribosomal protein S18 acetylase RimI-like enzyme
MSRIVILCCRKRAYFVDLFVRVSNKVAINMYTNLGYIVYRTVLEYYSGDPDEDAYGRYISINIFQIIYIIFWQI